MLEIGRRLDLGEEALATNDRGQLGAKHLERHAAVVAHVVGEEDCGHAALPDLSLDAIAVGKVGGYTNQRVSHRSRIWHRDPEESSAASTRCHPRATSTSPQRICAPLGAS